MVRGTIFALIFALFSAIGSHCHTDVGGLGRDKIVACYVATWAQYRVEKIRFELNDLQPKYCTHVIYAFAGLNNASWTIKSLDAFADLEEDYGKGGYKKMTQLRAQYPGLKISLAIGGWNEGSAQYSQLSASQKRRSTFVASVHKFLRNYGFDGLDLDWEFPGKRGGNSADKGNFVSLVRDLSRVLKPDRLLLTAAISADKMTINEGYDVVELSKYLDYIHLMAYDYHGPWDKRVGPNAPLKCQDELCIEASINHLLELGAPRGKLVVGLPMYGRTFILKSELNDFESPIGATTETEGFKGNFTGENGFMGYNEICLELQVNPKNWRVGWEEDSQTAYAVNSLKVIVYDNATSAESKVDYVRKMNLAGVMIWSIDTDDFNGDCGPDYPMMRAIYNSLYKKSTPAIELNDSNVILPLDTSTKWSSGSFNQSSYFVTITTTIFVLYGFFI